MDNIARGDLVVLDLDDAAAERLDGALRRRDLFLGVDALHRGELSADLDERQAQLRQNGELRDSARGCDVELLAVLHGEFLCPRMNALDALELQFVTDFGEPLDALAERVEQREVEVILQNAQRHTGKARAGADINDRFALEIDKLQDCRAVEQVELRDGVGLCDGREVHHLILFQQQGGEALERFRPAYIQPQLAEALQEKLVHLLCSFKRSRISASRTSSFVGSGAFSGSGSAGFESLSCILLMALTMQNTAKAMMIKSRMTAIRLP